MTKLGAYLFQDDRLLADSNQVLDDGKQYVEPATPAAGVQATDAKESRIA